MKVFLDTNVVLDFLGERDPFYQDALRIITMARVVNQIDITISSLTVINVAYILRRSFSKDIVISKLKSFLAICDISAIDKQIIIEAINTESYDFEDKVQQLSAVSADADIIITRDEKGFSDCEIPVFTPSEFMRKVQE